MTPGDDDYLHPEQRARRRIDEMLVAAGWAVQDVAAHVLGDHVGRLSRGRDGRRSDGPRAGEASPAFIHRINDEWVTAARRLSPAVLLDLVRTVGEQVLDHWRRTDLHAQRDPVSWAGPDPAPAWLDAARDHSEYWVHRRQIAEAVGRTGPAVPTRRSRRSSTPSRERCHRPSRT